MGGVRRLTGLGSVGVVVLLAVTLTLLSDHDSSASRGAVNSQQPQPATLTLRILSDERIWGDDAIALFGSLPAWRDAGETTVIVFPDRAVGSTASETADSLQARVSRFSAALKRIPARTPAPFSALYTRARARVAALRAQVVRSREDDRFHLTVLRDNGQFLKPGLTIASVRQTYGAPERTTTEVIHSDGDRRPTVLTVLHYENGAVRFAESDLAPRPGLVDRVFVDVAAASAQLFR